MAEKDLTIERVVATVRERGPIARLDLRAVLGYEYPSESRRLDRLLQKARKSGLLRCSGGRWVAAEHEADAEKIARLEKGRDAAQADRSALQSALDAAMVEHSALEAERARLARENEGLREAVAEFEATDAEVREFVEKCKAAQGLAFCAFCGEVTPRDAIAHHISGCVKHPMREVERDRDSLRARLTALTAEHESAARAAEESVGKLAGMLCGALDTLEHVAPGLPHRGPCGPECAADCRDVRAIWIDIAAWRAALAEVKP